ncbi:hypothetical protein LTR47_011156 [Exophiala xenobiotica]|nr:hypothetical protein LTR47_011156 [Exophiala xenobiotica]KAK5347143.1 hypothetical protein LTR61_009024 [Exophiala xenobiotica]
MAPRGDSSIRFLVWTSGEQAEEDIHQQSFSRHQHAARAGHRNKKLQPDRTQYGDSAMRASSKGAKTSPRAKRSKSKTKLTPTSGKGKALLRVPPSANRMDPFDTCSVSGISACAEMMLQFAITHQWPAYSTSCEATAVDKWKGTTVKIAVDSPCLLQAIIYAGSCYRSFLGPGDSSIEQVRTQSYHETLTLLRKEIQALKGPPPEELLLAIVILAINGTPDYSNRHALTTLEHYRDNEFYFRKPWAPEHFQALTSLTILKGGLRSISIGPIAAMIFMYVTPSSDYGLLTDKMRFDRKLFHLEETQLLGLPSTKINPLPPSCLSFPRSIYDRVPFPANEKTWSNSIKTGQKRP